MATTLAPPQGYQPGLEPTAKRVLTAIIIAAHLLAGWSLLQLVLVQKAAIEIELPPLVVSLIAARPQAAPPQPSLPRQRLQKAMALTALAPSRLQAPASFEPALTPDPLPLPPLPAQVTAPAPATTATAVPPTTPTPPTIKQVAPNAVRYLAEPRMTVPLLSRRLGEAGMVHLRIRVDAKGVLQEAQVKKSSGFSRLDEQALQDIRTARFYPQINDQGQAVEWETTALLSYELGR